MKLLRRRWGGKETDSDEAKEGGQESREDGVAIAEDSREIAVDERRVPEEGDESADSNAGNCGCGCGSTPEEGGEDDRSESGSVDGVGVERFFED